MDLRQLRSFIQVAEMRSITRAAAALHTAQPALSRQIKLLEEELGGRLFERSERGVALTGLGEQLLHRATALVRDFDSLRGALSSQSKGVSGHVRFGVPKSLVESFIAPALVRFLDQHPAISMSLIEGTTLEIREQVRAGALDLAIVSDLDRSPASRMHPLLVEPLVLVSHPTAKLRMTRAVSPSFVARQLLATTNRPNVIRLTLEDVLGREGLTPRIGLEANSHASIRAVAASGKMHGVIPYSAVALELDTGRATAAPIAGATVGWNVIATPLRALPRHADVLKAFVLEAAAAWAKQRPWLGSRVDG